MMRSQMRENLLGYLCGALDDDEHREMDALLQEDAELKEEFDRLQSETAPLEIDRQRYLPPAGLKQRTCRLVAQRRRASEETSPMQPGAWTLRDMVVGCAVMAAALLIFFPAVSYSRFQSQVAYCQNNLRQLGIALHQYSDSHGDIFPLTPLSGNEAIGGGFVATLASNQLLSSDNLAFCPGVASSRESHLPLPTREEILQADPVQLRVLGRRMGDYRCSMGYTQGREYRPIHDRRRSNFALLSDSPSADGLYSRNHGRCGQNILFECGRVCFIVTCRESAGCDDFYRNDAGQIAPGTHENDAVIVAGFIVLPLNFAPAARTNAENAAP